MERHCTHTTGSHGKKKKSRKEINRDYYLKNKNKNAGIKRTKNKSAVKKYQIKTNPAQKRNNLKSVKKYQATNSLYKAENLEAVKRSQATNSSYKPNNLEAIKRNQNKNPDCRTKNLEAAKKHKAKTRAMLVTNRYHLAPTREEYDENDNGVVPSGLDDIERVKVSLLRRLHWPQYTTSHCLENQENYKLVLKRIQEQHISPEKQRYTTQRCLLAQG